MSSGPNSNPDESNQGAGPDAGSSKTAEYPDATPTGLSTGNGSSMVSFTGEASTGCHASGLMAYLMAAMMAVNILM